VTPRIVILADVSAKINSSGIHRNDRNLRGITKTSIDAISRLGNPEKMIEHQYKLLLKEDMKANTAVADPNAQGQSKAKPAWFWSSNLAGDMWDNEQMVECKASHTLLSS